MGRSAAAASSALDRALQLLAAAPDLGGLIACGSRPDLDRLPCRPRRIPPHAQLTGYPTPWGWQKGLLDEDGAFFADLDLLPPESQAILAQRLDRGGCLLVACASSPPWAHLADRVAFLIPAGAPAPRPPRGRTIRREEAIAALAGAAQAFQVEGHRAEGFALRAAEAAACAAGRKRLTEGDVAEAIALVLAPRARAVPEPEEPPQQEPEERRQAGEQREAEAPPQPVPIIPLPPAPVAVRPALYGAPVGAIPGRTRRGSLDLPATILAALPWQRLRGAVQPDHPPSPRLRIRPADLRWQLRRPRQGRLILFVVDGSGSMGARRLGQAKGAVLRLLQEAYRRRDQVALILAAGSEARLLLPPARAVEQARRRLAAVPAGGGTPLAGALLIALRLALQARQQDGRSALMVLMTDGRANLPLQPPSAPSRPASSPSPSARQARVREELKQVALALRTVGVQSLMLGEPGPEALELARWLGAPLYRIGLLLRPGSLLEAAEQSAPWVFST